MHIECNRDINIKINTNDNTKKNTKSGRGEWTCWLGKDHTFTFFNDTMIIPNEKKNSWLCRPVIKTLSCLKGILILEYSLKGNRNTQSFKSYFLVCLEWNIVSRCLHQLGTLLGYLCSPEARVAPQSLTVWYGALGWVFHQWCSPRSWLLIQCSPKDLLRKHLGIFF